MGLFSKKQREPRVHPAVDRTIHVPAPMDDVERQLEGYSALHSFEHAVEVTLRIGEHEGWTTLVLPPRLHPATFHNLGFWLLDTPNGGAGTMLRSGPSGENPAYALVDDPELSDCLCGIDTLGEAWTVWVPSNEITRADPVPATADVSALPEPGVLREITLRLEDPGHDMNPDNDSTATSRTSLIPRWFMDSPVA
jgi:hypothetical protein